MCSGAFLSIARTSPERRNFKRAGTFSHVGGREDGDAIVFQQAPNVAQEAGGVFQMFDDFDGGNHVELIGEIAVELGIIEIELYEFRFQLEIIFQVCRGDLKSRGLQAFRERAAAGPEIERARCGGA